MTLRCDDKNEEVIDEFPAVFQYDNCTVEGFGDETHWTTSEEPKHTIKVPGVVQELSPWNMKFPPKLLKMKEALLSPETVIMKSKMKHSSSKMEGKKNRETGKRPESTFLTRKRKEKTRLERKEEERFKEGRRKSMKEGFLEATRGLPGSLETLKDVEMKGTQLNPETVITRSKENYSSSEAMVLRYELMNVAYHLVDYDAGETVKVMTLRLCLKTIFFLLWRDC